MRIDITSITTQPAEHRLKAISVLEKLCMLFGKQDSTADATVKSHESLQLKHKRARRASKDIRRAAWAASMTDSEFAARNDDTPSDLVVCILLDYDSSIDQS